MRFRHPNQAKMAGHNKASQFCDDASISQRESILIEVISEGPHCIPCEYAIKSVREVAPSFGNRVEWRVVLLKEREGAERYLELTRKLGKNPPIPSILINEHLTFERIPGPHLLRTTIERVMEGKEMECPDEETF